MIKRFLRKTIEWAASPHTTLLYVLLKTILVILILLMIGGRGAQNVIYMDF